MYSIRRGGAAHESMELENFCVFLRLVPPQLFDERAEEHALSPFNATRSWHA
jgi:hypothetical protein